VMIWLSGLFCGVIIGVPLGILAAAIIIAAKHT
jgi:hypothetical protein